MHPTRAALVSTAVLAALALGGCGSEGSEGSDGSASTTLTDTPSPSASSSGPSTGSSPTGSATPASPSASAAPADWRPCDTLWRDGARLPRFYPGCSDEGAAVPAQRLGCSSGQQIVTYGDHFFAVAGGLVSRTETALPRSRVYLRAVRICRG